MAVTVRNALINWGRGHPDSAYLACGILKLEGATEVRPVHPQGGPDGQVDIFCTYQGVKCVAAVHFPNASTTVGYSKIKKKFIDDLAGVQNNGCNGFLFITNAPISKAEHDELEAIGSAAACAITVIFSLERLVATFTDPRSWVLRRDYLDIDTTMADMLAYHQTVYLDEQRAREKREVQMGADVAKILDLLSTTKPEGGSQ